MTEQEKVNRAVQRRNAAFKKMTAAQKRVAIAKDVLRQIGEGLIRPTRGTYLAMGNRAAKKVEKAVGKDLSELLPTITCNSCAIGSLALSAIGYADQVKIQDPSEWSDNPTGCAVLPKYNDYPNRVRFRAHQYLAKFFPGVQREQMESVFEHAEYWVKHKGNNHDVESFQGLSARERLVRIMKNVIKNKGTFKPEQFRAAR